MSDPFSSAGAVSELPRDRWGRPLITPPEGGDPVAYTRVTTFVKAIDDTFFLTQWAKRMVVVGMAARRDLLMAAIAVKDPDNPNDKKTLNRIAESAIEASKAHARAEVGTALHAFTELLDAGRPLDSINVPDEYVGDLRAYLDARRYLGEPVAMEGFCVVDALRVGGSYDRIWRFTADALAAYEADHGRPLAYPDGTPVAVGDTIIGDLKTGRSIDFGIGAIAMQLATYANAEDYDHTLGSRRPTPVTNREWGLVVHLPAGEARAVLVWVDLAAAWQTVRDVLPVVHAWRKRKDLAYPMAAVSAAVAGNDLVAQIHAATSREELVSLYVAHAHIWTPGLTALAKARTEELGK